MPSGQVSLLASGEWGWGGYCWGWSGARLRLFCPYWAEELSALPLVGRDLLGWRASPTATQSPPEKGGKPRAGRVSSGGRTAGAQLTSRGRLFLAPIMTHSPDASLLASLLGRPHPFHLGCSPVAFSPQRSVWPPPRCQPQLGPSEARMPVQRGTSSSTVWDPGLRLSSHSPTQLSPRSRPLVAWQQWPR